MLDENIKVTLANGPRPRKHAALWQAYLWYNEWLEMKKRHLLRISAAERGASDMDAQLEKDLMEKFNIVKEKDELGRILARYGKTTGDIWYWCTEIRGLKNGVITAQLLAQIDDIERFATIAKLWRFCGWAVIDGKAEKNQPGEASHYNGRLKGVCFNIAEAFIKQQTPGYVDIYYAEKTRQRDLHPVAICKICNVECNHEVKEIKGKLANIYTCPYRPEKHAKKLKYTDMHINFRGKRKMIKAFLKDLWLAWRKFENLPVTPSYELKIERVIRLERLKVEGRELEDLPVTESYEEKVKENSYTS